jgi:hypothetical protein
VGGGGGGAWTAIIDNASITTVETRTEPPSVRGRRTLDGDEA